MMGAVKEGYDRAAESARLLSKKPDAGAIVPVQFRTAHSTSQQPELDLWAAVLTQALEDLGAGDSGERIAAEVWFHHEDDYFGSFVWICGLLGFDSDAVRAKTLAAHAMRKAQATGPAAPAKQSRSAFMRAALARVRERATA